MKTPDPIAFDFGSNWREFSRHALTPDRVAQARAHFQQLLSPLNLEGRSFLDIGFGQGLSLLAASARGARAVGCDINPKCAEVLAENRNWFADAQGAIPVVIGSILCPGIVEQCRALAPDGKAFDVVHSWGVLHHTGDMAGAIAHAAALTNENGYLILAIYNRHWTSPLWSGIKWTFNRCPRLLQRLMIAVFFPVIYLAKLLVTRENPLRQTRGMDFYYNVIDWVGGYPYEYAAIAEIEQRMRAQGFQMLKALPAQVPTGCNEFVFRRLPAAARCGEPSCLEVQ